MTVQMREGWVLCRNGKVDYAKPNVEGEFVKTHPWCLRHSCESVRNDGRFSTVWRNADSGHDVVELLDPWDDRVPEEHREKRFVVARERCWNGIIYEVVYDRHAKAFSRINAASETIESVCNSLNGGTDSLTRKWLNRIESFVSIDGKPCNPDGSPIAEQPKPVDEPVPAVEPESLPYKVGDRGVTRDGRVAECIEDREDMSHPLRWESFDQRWSTARNGISSRSTHFDIVRRLDDANFEPGLLAYEVLDPASRTTRTLRTDHYGVYAECRDGSEPVVKIVANTQPGCSVAQARALVAMILAVCEEIER